MEIDKNRYKFIPCGPWLGLSNKKRALLFILWYPKCSFYALWKSKYFWWRWLLSLLKIKYYLTMADIVDKTDLTEDVVKNLACEKAPAPNEMYGTLFALYQPRWLWYESLKQLMNNREKIDYIVDWDEKNLMGWYPFK